MSLFDPVYSDSGNDNLCVMDSIQDNSCSDDAWLDDIALREALKQLSERERRIINLRFFRGRTQMEIAEEIGISQAQVSRLEKGAIDKMRCNMQ
jgi:RNA polymerase sporulation-specific sigma factor